MTVSDIKRLKELEEKNRRLKRMFVDLSLRAACDILDLSRSVYHYRHDTGKDLPVIDAIQRIEERHHDSLDDLTLIEFLHTINRLANSNF